MYLNKNNNKKKIKTKNQKGGEDGRERECVKRAKIFLFFSFFASLSDLRNLDHRFSSEQKAELVYKTRATRRYQNLGVSLNFTR